MSQAVSLFGSSLIQTPAVSAVIPELVPENQYMRINGINATIQSVVQFAAPAMAGLVLTFSTLRMTLGGILMGTWGGFKEHLKTLIVGMVLFGFFYAIYSAFLPIGMIIFGPLSDVVSMRWIMLGSGIALILLGIATIRLGGEDKTSTSIEKKIMY